MVFELPPTAFSFFPLWAAKKAGGTLSHSSPMCQCRAKLSPQEGQAVSVSHLPIVEALFQAGAAKEDRSSLPPHLQARSSTVWV